MSETVLSIYRGVVPAAPRFPTMTEIAQQVCEEYEITMEELRGQRRCRIYILPRQAFMWRCRQVRFSGGSHRFRMVQIAAFLNKLDHACISHGVATHQRRLDTGYPQPVQSPVHDRDCRTDRTRSAA